MNLKGIPMKKEDVRLALESLSLLMTDLQDALASVSHRAADREKIKTLYSTLKADLQTAAHHGTIDGEKRPRTDVEESFYHPAVCGALTHLKPAINSDPQTADWLGAIENAKCDLDMMLYKLDGGSD